MIDLFQPLAVLICASLGILWACYPLLTIQVYSGDAKVRKSILWFSFQTFILINVINVMRSLTLRFGWKTLAKLRGPDGLKNRQWDTSNRF